MLPARQQAVAKLLDQHGTGRVLFRNSRANIQGFPERHLNVYPMPLPGSTRPPSR
jgi:ATP-dependent helicase HepA